MTIYLYFLGIDVLSSGYDAATWTSKYSIFDFKEEGETVHINSINKTYTAPAMVNVVTDGMNSKRVEDSCIDVATHFEGDSNLTRDYGSLIKAFFFKHIPNVWAGLIKDY